MRPPKGETWSVVLPCAHCGSPVTRNRARVPASGRVFCGNDCYGASKAGRPVLTPEQYAAKGLKERGPNHANWKGGPEVYKVSGRAWYDKNIESILHRSARRRARRFNAAGSHTLAEWLALKEEQAHRCARCKRHDSEATLTRDHIVALAAGGSDDISNIQALCKACNSRKYRLEDRHLVAGHGVHVPQASEVA